MKSHLINILFVIVLVSCKSTTETDKTDPRLELISTFQLEIKQPSGIAFNEDYSCYWIIDGETERIFKTDLSGKILERLAYKGDDLEGICFDKSSNSLWVVEEETRQVVNLDLGGNEIGRFTTNITGSKNNGLEGITFDEQHNIFVVNEKNPEAVYSLGKDYNYTRKVDFPIAADLSDIYYNPSSKYFFVLSDESKAIYIWNTKEGVVTSFKLPCTKMEGITANPLKNRVVLVNDSLNTMYEYELKN